MTEVDEIVARIEQAWSEHGETAACQEALELGMPLSLWSAVVPHARRRFR